MRYAVSDIVGHTESFGASVIDTTKNMKTGESLLCECVDRATADRIAKALNLLEQTERDYK